MTAARSATIVRAVLGAAYVVLASQVPVAIQTTSGHDDGLFWSRAMHIVDGDWLGAYDQLTLAKGPTYSVFLALNNLAGTSVLLSMALLHLLACWMVTREVERLGLPRWWAVATFAAILFHPSLIPTRIIRDDIYAPLTLLALAGALRAYRSAGGRRGGTIAVLVTGGIGLGLLWATREEGVWVVPGFGLLALAGAVGSRRSRAGLVRLGGRLVLYVVAATVVVGALVGANAVVYDRAVLTDVTDSAFADAVTTLTSIDTGPVVPRVPVTERMRDAAYDVSPAMVELRGSLEAPDNKWRGIGCPDGCADFSGGWWMWALRDAVADAGYYRDAPTAATFFERITDEVGAACETGRLACRSSSIPFMPHLTESQWRDLPGLGLRAARLLAVRDGAVMGTGVSADPLPWLNDVRAFLNDPPSVPSPTEDRLMVSGWYHDPDGGWLDLDCPSGGERVTAPVPRLDSPDVAAIFGQSAERERFALDLDLDRSGCALTPTSGAAPVALADVVAQGPSGRLLGAATLQVEAASAVRGDAPPTWARTVVDALTVGYRWVAPFVLAGGLIGLLVGLVRLRKARTHAPLLVVAVVAWVLVATRCAILVLVDVTSFDAVHPGYLSAAFPLAVLAAAAGLGCLPVPRGASRGRGRSSDDEPDTVAP